MKPRAPAVAVALLTGLAALLCVVPEMSAPANYGAHGLTTGFGRGREDVAGIVSEGRGRIDLPSEPMILTVRLSGSGLTHLRGSGAEQSFLATETPTTVRLELPEGGPVEIESPARIRLFDLSLGRDHPAAGQAAGILLLGIIAAVLIRRGARPAALGAVVLGSGLAALLRGTLSGVFASVALAKLVPAFVILVLLTPLFLAIRTARFQSLGHAARPIVVTAFCASLTLSAIQLAWFAQPLPLGDPGAYLEMGGRFAEALARLGNPFEIGPALTDLRPYLALPATGVLYGVLRFLSAGLGLIYAAQALAMALAVAALVGICEAWIGRRAAWLALFLALLHPSFSILPGIVQPEPFILAAWTLSALLALHASEGDGEPRAMLGSAILLGLGLALHPQGLSFLLLALLLCLAPWARSLWRRPSTPIALALGACSVLLPVAAAEHFAKPMAYVLDREYGFFAYTSPHPLGFWLYTDSDGWQGPLRIEDTTYQKELIALKGETATASNFADVAAFVSRHPGASLRAVLTNVHRLWDRPDNPFAAPFVLPADWQPWLHRGLVVLFVLSLPALLGSRLAPVALPFVMLSMTYPAYHIFNKYATPALPFTIIGASLVLDRVLGEHGRNRLLLAGLMCAAAGSLMPATVFARLGVPGGLFLLICRVLLWGGLLLALSQAVRIWGVDLRSRVLGAAIGLVVLIAASVSASRTDTTSSAWSVALDTPREVSCTVPAVPAGAAPAWLLMDIQSADGTPPAVEINGRAASPVEPTMPTFGLASIRGHRDPATFRQMWRVPVSEDELAAGRLVIRLSGGPGLRFFGDMREGAAGARLSVGDWPHLSVYRLMHEGQYRLPVTDAPPQACDAAGMSGRPGIALARIPKGEETLLGDRRVKIDWIF